MQIKILDVNKKLTKEDTLDLQDELVSAFEYMFEDEDLDKLTVIVTLE